MSSESYVAPADGIFADALFKVKGGLPHAILHRGVLSYLSGSSNESAETGSEGLPGGGTAAGMAVLEAGCGPGGFTKKLCRLKPGRVTAGDINERMLERARKRVIDSRVTFVPLDLTKQFAFADSEFDLVICISVLMHLAPAVSANAIAEFGRVCRSGGTVLVAVLNTDWAESIYESAPEDGPFARRVPAGETVIREFYPPAAHYLEAFRAAGMTVERREICVPPEGVDAGPPYDARVGDPVWTMYLGMPRLNLP